MLFTDTFVVPDTRPTDTFVLPYTLPTCSPSLVVGGRGGAVTVQERRSEGPGLKFRPPLQPDDFQSSPSGLRTCCPEDHLYTTPDSTLTVKWINNELRGEA